MSRTVSLHHRTIPHASFFDKFFDSVGRRQSDIQDTITSNKQQEVDEEEEEGEATFIKLDPNSTSSVDGSGDATFGPLAILAVGLLVAEFQALTSLLQELGAEEVTLVPCTQYMLEGSLGDALSIDEPPEHEAPVLGARRVVFLSGMYSSEVIDVVAAVRETDALPDMAFAAAVPKSWNRNLKELVEDVCADHAMMAKRRAAAALEAAQAAALREDQEEEDA